jgi:hypothetical protein
MKLAFFVAPFNRAVRPDGHDGSGIAGAFHREIISWIAVAPQARNDEGWRLAGANPRGGADWALLAGAPRASVEGGSALRVTIPFAGGARRAGPMEKVVAMVDSMRDYLDDGSHPASPPVTRSLPLRRERFQIGPNFIANAAEHRQTMLFRALNTAGSSKLRCSRLAWPGKSGQLPFALSQTVTTYRF